MKRFFYALSAGLLAFSLASCAQNDASAATAAAEEENLIKQAALDASASFQDEVIFPEIGRASCRERV